MELVEVEEVELLVELVEVVNPKAGVKSAAIINVFTSDVV